MSMRIIDVEAHLYTPAYLAYLRSRKEPPRQELLGDDQIRVWQEPSAPDTFQQRSMAMEDLLTDLTEIRLKRMDEAGIDVQALSLNIPGCEQFEPVEGARVAREANDELAAVVAEHPDRFVGLAALAPDPGRPEVAADELERCVKELGFRGAKINSHIRDTYLDDRRYDPLLERAEALGVPIFLHPILPHANMLKPYTGYGWALAGPGLGFGHETAVHAMRMVYGGVFDRFPKLQVVLGHLGEGLYFWLYRLDFDFTKPWLAGGPTLERRPSDYLRGNFHVTISGHFQLTSFTSTLAEIGVDRMLFATDYPYESVEQAIQFIEDAPLSTDDKEKIFHGNATRLLGL
jgi:predicted TIM-barrel fold metal-dependent hydrolase